MSEKVARLPTEQHEVGATDLPPFTMTLVMNMAGERQIHIASPVTAPVSPDEANRRADALMKVAERQRSLIEIRMLEDELSAKTDALEKVWKVRQAEAEAKHAGDLAQVEAAIAEDMKKQEQLKHAAYNEARAAGRTGEIKLQGARAKDFGVLERAIEQHRASVAKKEAEHLQHMQTFTGNVEKLDAEIREINRQLARHRAIAG